MATISGQTAAESETVASAAEKRTATLTVVSDMTTDLTTQADNLQAELAEFDVDDTATTDEELTLPSESSVVHDTELDIAPILKALTTVRHDSRTVTAKPSTPLKTRSNWTGSY